MKKVLIAGFFAPLLLSLAGTLYAQEGSFRFGLGVGMGKEINITPLTDTPYPFVLSDSPVIYLPMDFSCFRLEPEIGLFTYFVGTSDDISTVLPLGLGAFWRKHLEKSDLYFGVRFGMSFWWLRDSSDGDIEVGSKYDVAVGPAAGAEYFFSDHLSGGGEAQILYAHIGSLYTYGYEQKAANLVKSKTILFLRWYF